MYTPNQEIEQYLQQIEAAIYHLAESDGFIDGLRQQLYDYAEVHTILSISALVEEFGTPEEVAKNKNSHTGRFLAQALETYKTV